MDKLSTKHQIDNIIDNLDDDVTWLICYHRTTFHFIRCEYINESLTGSNYILNCPCTNDIYKIDDSDQTQKLSAFIKSKYSTANILYRYPSFRMLTMINYKRIYEYSNKKSSFITHMYNGYGLCVNCYKWFKRNKFRFPELAIDDTTDIKLVLSNGKQFAVHHNYD